VPTVSEVGKEGNAQKLNREALCLGRSVLCLCRRWCLVLKVGRGRLSVQARLAVQEGVFLDRAAGARLLADGVGGAMCGIFSGLGCSRPTWVTPTSPALPALERA
jgi:hypothetical protein